MSTSVGEMKTNNKRDLKNLLVNDLPFNGHIDPVNFYENKRKFFMKNNIFKEIEERKMKEGEQLNFLKLMQVGEKEYEKSKEEATQAIESLTESHISELLCKTKLLHIERNIVELLDFLTGNFYFHWQSFKQSTNFYELKYKMHNVEFDKLDSSIINRYLNKITQKKEFDSEYLKENFETGFTLFNWIKSIMKIYLYKYQTKTLGPGFSQKLQNNHATEKNSLLKKNKSNDTIPPKRESKTNLKKTILSHTEYPPNNDQNNFLPSFNQKISAKTNSDHTAISAASNKMMNLKTVSMFSSKSKHENTQGNSVSSNRFGSIREKILEKELYLTQFKGRHASLSKEIGTDSAPRIFNPKPAPQMNLTLDIDVSKRKRKKSLEKLQDIPLLYVRTFGQLRRHFKPTKVNIANIRDRHFEQLKNFSLRDSHNNEDIVVNFISKGKLKAIENDVIEDFVEKKKYFLQKEI